MAQRPTTVPADPVCPDCGTRMVPIVYGYPGPGMFEDSQRGKIALGGCVVTGFDATHRCEQGHQWRWRGIRTQFDPGAAAGMLVPGGAASDGAVAATGWVSMTDLWDEFVLDEDDPDGDPYGDPEDPST